MNMVALMSAIERSAKRRAVPIAIEWVPGARRLRVLGPDGPVCHVCFTPLIDLPEPDDPPPPAGYRADICCSCAGRVRHRVTGRGKRAS